MVLLMVALPTMGQDSSFEEFRQRQRAQFEQFKTDKQDSYDLFRQRANTAYAEFMRKAWEDFPVREGLVPFEEDEVPPMVYPDDAEPAETENDEPEEPNNDSIDEPAEPENAEPEEPENDDSALVVSVGSEQSEHATNWSFSLPKFTNKPREITVQPNVTVVPSAPPTPEPIAPVKPQPNIPTQSITVNYYGSTVTLGFPQSDRLKLADLNEETLADAWQTLSGKAYDISVKTALDVRDGLQLCDWAYLDVLRALTEKQYGATNEAVLMQAYLMTQTGYRIRLAKTQDRLFLLIASNYEIYRMRYVSADGVKYYITGDYNGERLQLCRSKFDKEQSLSLQLARLPKLKEEMTPKRTLTSKKGVTASVSVNKNLIAFFNQYPQANIDGDFATRWAAYANTPLEKNVQDELYPTLRRTITSMKEREAVGILLNWVQTAFKYAYDNDVWGVDRAFFVQETLYYPQSDCEDRAILFSRIVRDIVGLDVVLLYYPGHLATAVAFTNEEPGDWFMYNGRRYVVCDPTYINAPVGATMPGMDNKTAKIIVLK